MLRLRSCVLFFLISSCFASAQLVPKGNVYFGYAYNRAEVVTNDARNFNGWDASLEGKLVPWVGIAGDLNGNYTNHSSEYNFLFGPRVSVEVSRFRPFAQLLIGATHISVSNGADSDTSFGNAVGGGLDYKVLGPASLRGELDWIHTRFFSHGQNDVRFTTGFVLNF
jgi:hypothetical protein